MILIPSAGINEYEIKIKPWSGLMPVPRLFEYSHFILRQVLYKFFYLPEASL